MDNLKSWNKINLTKEAITFMKENYASMSASKLQQKLLLDYDISICINSLYAYMGRLGVRKSKQAKPWKQNEVDFLTNNYKTKGNIEIAEFLNSLPNPSRNFNKKNIEKKMGYLNLKRTELDLQSIRERNVQRKRFHGRPSSCKVGTIKIWNVNGYLRKYIKLENGFTPLARHIYIQHFGDIPEGYKVYFKDKNPFNCEVSNLAIKKAGCIRYSRKAEKKEKKRVKIILHDLTAIEVFPVTSQTNNAFKTFDTRIKSYV